ncbi:hypothetical protein JCM19037_2340 [Geomicrobium sp. JCM 19037]|uniref:methyl-accepting chemotaxis protein n=1 Tax=Geomicrobium sp. JCM 19037 TaxID=1460634 RepID=UPI00045F41B6|nr:methyl-accepting chemotaxis protein [Geomicrobium sp. JCM 19037]GAK03972.1 hypothetical protein JCM19037_2340 [Geomicrobium sp. JCM 19037]
MKRKENTVMLAFTAFVLGIMGLVSFLHGYVGWLDTYLLLTGRAGTGQYTGIIAVLFFLPIVLFVLALIVHLRSHAYKWVQWLVMLSLTFSSIAIIAIGDGLVEYHFSIFMVLAALAYYAHLHLIIVSTIIFALQHFVGYFTFPELICGTDQYPFSLLMIHAVFLLATSGALMIQIVVRNRHAKEVNEQTIRHQSVIKALLGNIASTTDAVTSNVAQLQHTSADAKLSANRTVETFSHIDLGAVTQVENAYASKGSLIKVVEVAEAIIQRNKETEERASVASHSSQEGAHEMNRTMEGIREIATSTEEMTSSMTELNEKTKEINKISSFITSIAEQTNLLSLNAAIEAARAGEAGAGFSVVAKEIRTLSEQSDQNARSIITLIQQIQSETDALSTRMSKNLKTTREGFEQSERTQQYFEAISKQLIELHDDLRTSLAHTSEINIEANSALEKVNNMTDVSEQYRETVKESNEQTDRQLRNTQVIERAVNELKQVLHELNDNVSELQLKEA